ncbi:hypothetical protein F4808DRAFT_256584 [Astrocystis sublimbata]|nr:hypothetical protein F4808DRAFT_256584 [Astrocystis sublimbata]
MIGTSVPEYIAIRLAIFGLRYTSPLCLATLLALTALKGTAGISSWTGKALAGYCVVDALFAIFVYQPYNHRLEQAAEHPPLPPPAERRELFSRCLDNVPNVAVYLQTWFLKADVSDIRRENVWEFISWAFFDRHPGNETVEEHEELDEYVAMIERRVGYQFQPGKGRAESLRVTLDKIKMNYRSVLWYVIVGGVDLTTHIILSRSGFRYYAQPWPHSFSVVPPRLQSLFTKKQSVSRLAYWYRPHTAKNKLPLVFLHGIGIGLWPYTPYFSYINRDCGEDEQIGIIAIEYLPISMRFTDVPLSQADFLAQITCIVDAHGWGQFAVVAHSYGTFLATQMVKSPSLSPRIQSIILVDPVSILLHLPNVAYNFTRRKPRKANEYLLWYFASTDPGVAHCLGRHLFWKDSIAWKEDLLHMRQEPHGIGASNSMIRPKASRERKVTVCLAERDLIVDTPTVLKYLTHNEDWATTDSVPDKNCIHSKDLPQSTRHFENSGIEVVWFDGLDHAQVFDYKDSSARLATLTLEACARG